MKNLLTLLALYSITALYANTNSACIENTLNIKSIASLEIKTTPPGPIIGMVGTALNGWPTMANPTPDILMTEVASNIYEAQDITFGDGLMRFRTDFDPAQPSYGGDTFPLGIITSTDILVTAGVYDVTLNLVTNTYSFILDPFAFINIGIVGPAANGWPDIANPTPDVLMSTVDGVNYQLSSQTLTTGDLIFRQDQQSITTWSSIGFPSGTGSTTSSSNIPVTEGSYNIYFNKVTGNYNFESTIILIAPKVFLQGAGLNRSTVVGEENWMRDDLRALSILKSTSPYSIASVASTVFDVTGSDAIVDWVFIEIRDAIDNTIIIDSASALVQRDGDVVDVDGVSAISIPVTEGSYYVAIKHRTHLGIMTANTLVLTNSATVIDFTDANNPITYGTNAQTNFGMPTDILALWAGNVGGDTTVKYQGSSNDTNAIKDKILENIGNTANSNLFSFTAYNDADINLDGTIKYQGSNNDSNIIKDIVLSHTDNTSSSNLFAIDEQLPGN